MTIKSPPTEQTAVDQLEKLAAEFTQWRKQKKIQLILYPSLYCKKLNV